MSESDAPAADWYTDPSGRFQFRYWDGETWTGHVSTDGKTDWDPPGDTPPDGDAATAGPAATADAAAAADAAAGTDGAGSGDAVVDSTPASDTPAGDAVADDAAWAPSGDVGTAAAGADVTADVGAVAAESADVSPSADEAMADADHHGTSTADPATLADDEPSDTNLVANRRAGVADDVIGWLDAVASQVEPRLSRISQDWAAQPQAEAARACAYGLLVGHLARVHPHMRPELSQVAEAHPSFTTLEAGSRLQTLEQIAGDADRSAAWLGPLIGAEDPQRVATLFD